MVERIQGLPGLPQVDQARVTQNVSIANPSAGGAMASAFESVARGARQVNQALQPVFDQRAQDEAIEEADRAAEASQNGELVTPELRRAFTREDRIYNQTLTQLTTARTMNDAREAFENMRRDYAFEPEKFDAAVQTWRDAYIGQLDTPYRVELEAAVDRMSLDYGLRIQDERRDRDAQRTTQETSRLIDDNMGRMYRMLRDDPAVADSEEYQEMRQDVLSALDSLYENPLIEGWYQNDAAISEAIELLETSEERALAFNEIRQLVDADDFDAAYERVEAIPSELQMDEEETQRFISSATAEVNRFRVRRDYKRAEARRIETEARQTQAREQQANYQRLVRSLADGTASMDDVEQAFADNEISEGQYTQFYVNEIAEVQREEALRLSANSLMARIEMSQGRMDFAGATELWENGDLPPEDFLAMQEAYNRELKANGEDPAEQAAMLELLRTTAAPDPTNREHREAVDLVYTSAVEATGGEGQTVYPERDRDIVMGIVAQYGVVPPTAATELRGGALSQDPALAIPALDTIAALSRAAPAASNQAFTERMVGDARVYANTVANGRSPEEAFAMIAGARNSIDNAGREIRQQEASSIVRDIDEDFINDMFTEGNWFRANPGLAPGQSAAALSTYRQLFRDSYTRYGDEEAAHSYAEASIRRTHGVTRMFGRSQIMRHPPEMSPHYQGISENVDWMAEQLVDAIVEIEGNEDLEFRNSLPDSIQLISDYETSVDVSNGRPPTYKVNYMRPDGVMETMPDRFVFDPSDISEETMARILADRERSMDYNRRLQEDEIAGVADQNEALTEGAIRDFLITDTGGGQQALARYERWRRENPDAAPDAFPGLPSTLFRSQ